MIPGFLLTAFFAAILSACGSGLLSSFVVLRRASFTSEAFAHIAFAGMASALLLGLPYGLVTFVFVSSVALVIGLASTRLAVAEVNLTTIFLAVSMALGVVLLSLNKGYTPDLSDYLFGNILLVGREDLIVIGALVVINLVWLIVFFRAMYYTTYNEEIARIFRIPTRMVSTVFLVLLACNIVVSAKLAGIIMVTAGLVLPGTIALLLTRRVILAQVYSVLVSVLATVLGFVFSYLADLPTGPLVVLVLFGFFLLVLAIRGLFKLGHHG